MKNFLIGVTSTLVAGIILFLLQANYEDWSNENSQALSVAISDEVAEIPTEQLRVLLDSNESSVRLHTLELENIGSDGIFDTKIFLTSKISRDFKIISSGSISEIGGNAIDLKFKKNQSGYEVSVPNIQKGESYRYWIASDCCNIFNVAPSTKDLKLTQRTLNFAADEDSNLSWWLWMAGALLAGGFLGTMIAMASVEESMKKRGFNMQEILKTKLEADAVDGKADA